MAKVVTPKNFKSNSPKVVKPTANFRYSEEYLEKEAQKRAEAEEKKRQQAAYEAITAPVKATNPFEIEQYKKENPNMYAVMGGQKYEPVPSKNATINKLTDEGKTIVEEARKRDTVYKQEVKSGASQTEAYLISLMSEDERALLNSAKFKYLTKTDKKLPASLSREEYTAVKKYADLYAEFSGIKAESADSTLARLSGDFENNENFQKSIEAKRKAQEDSNKNLDLLNMNESVKSKIDRTVKNILVTPYDDPVISAKLKEKDIADMTEAERNIYYRKKDVSELEADNFYKTVVPNVEARRIKSTVTWANNLGKNSNFLTRGAISALSVLFSIGAAPEQLANAIRYNETGIMGYNEASLISSGIRSGVTEKVNLKIGNWDAYDFIYNTAMSGVDSVVNTALFGPGASITLGLSAAASQSNDILQRGGTAEQAFWGGFASGVFEGVFEKFTIGNLKALKEANVDSFKSLFKNMAKSMVTNASEEFCTEVANIAYDIMMNGDVSNFNLAVEKYMQSGMSRKEAEAKAWQDLFLQAIEAGASGALMGIGFAGVGGTKSLITSNKKSYTKIGNNITENNLTDKIFDLAEGLDEKSAVKKFADQLKKSGEYNAADLGKLAVMVVSEIKQGAAVEVKGALYNRFIEAGQDSNTANKNAVALAKVLVGESLTAEQRKELLETALPSEIYSEMFAENPQPWVQELNDSIEKYADSLEGLKGIFDINMSNTADLNIEKAEQENNTEIEEEYAGEQDIDTLPDELHAEAQSDTENPVLQSSAKVGETPRGFRNSSDKEIYRPTNRQEMLESIGSERKNAKQRHITDIAAKLDSNLKIAWVDRNSPKLNGKNGKYVREINTIYLAKDMSVAEMYYEVFKHEFIHRLESKAAYKSFKDYLFGRSRAFEEYVLSQLKVITGEDFKGSREAAITELTNHYYNTFINDTTLGKPIRDRFTLEDAQREIVADFGGEVLFKGSENRADIAQSLSENDAKALGDIEGRLDALLELKNDDRNLFQRLWDVIKDFIVSLKMVAQNRRLVEDLEYIEQRFARVYNSRNTKKAAKQSGGVKYKIKYPTYTEKQIQANMEHIANMEAVYDVPAEKLEKTGKKPSDIFAETFESWGDNIYSDVFGDISVGNSSVKSEIRHGITAEKIASIEAIPAVIKAGKVIFYKTKTNSDVERIVVCAPITIGKQPYYMGVMLQRDSQNQRLYLHNVSIEKEMSETSQADLLTTGALEDNEHLSMTNILQRALSVKNNISTDSDNYSEDGPFSSGSPMQQARENLKKYENGELSREEYLEENERLWGETIEKYGSIPEGENAQAPIQTPKEVDEGMLTERFVRTIIETGRLTDEALENIEGKVLLGDFSYKAVSDEASIKKADTTIKNGTAEDIWESTVNSDKYVRKENIAIGEQLLADAIDKGDTKRVLELSSELADIFTRAGQVVQAARLLKQMTGAGRLISAQRAVKTLNRDLAQKYGVARRPVKISPEAADRLARAKTQKGIEHAYGEIMQEVADQMPSTFMDKFNAWRYFAMLSGPRTHIRNIVGNAIFLPMVRTKDTIAYVLEEAAVKMGKLDSADRTKSLIIKKEYADFAKNDGKNKSVQELLKGNKYNEKSVIKEKQKVFKSEVLNFITDFNSNLLEAEDILFKNKHYIHALAGYLQSRKVDLNNVSEQLLADARTYAVKEARKATFNDENAIADAIQKFSNKNLATAVAVEGILPYKRTPLNIIRRGVEYSPIGLTSTIIKGTYDVKKGKITVTEYIDGLASGLTGTGIMLVGMLLANLGIIAGGLGDDDESFFQKLMGKQEYSVEIFGKSYTIDFAAPAVMPFMLGAELINTMREGEELDLADVLNVAGNILEPITELSCLSGMEGVIESAKYADGNQALLAITSETMLSYATQSIPALLGATARTVDPTQRAWYIDKNSKWFDTISQTAWNNIRSKIPGLTYTLNPKINAWGQEVSRGKLGERAAENFISPGYYSQVDYNDMNNELLRLGKETGENIYPKTAAKSFSVNGETKYLTDDEYVTYAKAKGQYSHDYIDEFMAMKSYNKLTDDEKAKVIKNLYEYANAKAKTTVSDYDLNKQYKTVTRWEQNGNSAVDYYIYRVLKD